MKTDLAQDNQLLRRQLKELLANARKNEQKLQRLQAYELRLLGSASLHELVTRLIDGYRSFGGADVVTLAIIDPQYETERMLRDQGATDAELAPVIFLPNDDALKRVFGLSVKPKLGVFSERLHPVLLPATRRAPQSVALLPLVRNNELIGSLNLGSFSKEHFAVNAGTDFLERLSAIVALSLENCVNLERVKRIGLTDPLTGVNNRRFFDQRLQEEVARALRHDVPLSCLLLDIDHFKNINDTYGHPLGDRVLTDAAAIMRAQLRGSDLLARYGGEEFAALLTHTHKPAALEIAERIRSAIAEHEFLTTDGGSLRATLSIGVATLQHQGNDVSGEGGRLVSAADAALYAAKRGGRNRVCSDDSPALKDQARAI